MLSILVPVYNYSVHALVKSLQLSAGKSNLPYEIIVIDDCSTNKIYNEENESIATLHNVRFYRNDKNLGRTLTRMKLAEAAQYDTILFLDADVMPVHPDFIYRYADYIYKKTAVVMGGIAYEDINVHPGTQLRYKYGRLREVISADLRNKNPYRNILSANLLISRKIFVQNNYRDSDNLYGLDIYFSYNLFRNNVPVKHIDNPVYHLGLENNTAFFKKLLLAVDTKRKLLLQNEIEDTNRLLKAYNKVTKYRAKWLIALLFKAGEPALKKMILKKDPSLFCLDIYRLGYLCSIK